MATKYDKCDYCGGTVREKRVTVDLRIKGKLFVFDNVPVGVCQKCSERYYRGPVLERIGRSPKPVRVEMFIESKNRMI